VIFATVGSHPTFGFDRMLRALEALPGEELVVQHGPGRPPANARETFDFISFEQLLEQMSQASVVVSHAGVGSILCALQVGRVPVVMPREARWRETVDDHQVALAGALAPTGRIVLAESGDRLPVAVEEAQSQRADPIGDAAGLAGAVRAELGAA
jgi:UDP-N-acetylglucosamine transferase subunit ALG13